MISESQFTQRLLRVLRQAMPEAAVWKHNDLHTAGYPDFSVTRFDVGPYSKTVWVEVKLVGDTGQMFKPLQVAMLEKVGGWYIVWNPQAKRGYLFRADEREQWSEAPLTFNELVEKIARFF